LAATNKKILFVGTKRHLRSIVKAAATAAKMPYVTERWLGGTLTNFATISKRIEYLKKLAGQHASGELAETYSKKEISDMEEIFSKLDHEFAGIKDMSELPAALYVADVVTDKTAAREAKKLGIPVVGIVDTNADPQLTDYVIPANDDSVKTVTLISNLVAEAVVRGQQQAGKKAAPSTGSGQASKRVAKARVKPDVTQAAGATKAVGNKSTVQSKAAVGTKKEIKTAAKSKRGG
ncbi:30S ribosomal protein S2, partial [Candidatus Microgenomates bacterium]|nr:30S ribosomal protein S2 [Candidatus Microgenomates bacterium]